MGEVYEAIALSDPTQRYALKFIRSKGGSWYEHLHRFHQEATLLSQLYHPNVISLREFGITKQLGESKKRGSFYFIVMDFVKGAALNEIIKSNGKSGMNLDFFFQVACQMASALDYTHGKNIIHRDVKPHNIIVQKTTNRSSSIHAKLLDYGVATLGEVTNYIGGNQANPLDRVVGTPLYMAPEISKAKQKACDHRIDLYSLGCVLYQVIVGRPPFMHEKLSAIKQLHATKQPDDILSIRKDVPQVVSDIIMKLLAKDPDERYQTAFALYSDLLAVQSYIATPVVARGQELTPFPYGLGLNSNFRSLKRKLKMIGRAKELEQLIKFYNNVASEASRGHISLVCGGSGSGKSRLLGELKDYFVARKIKFISSQFIKYNSQTSLQCLASGFDEYLLKVMHHQPLEAKNIKERLKKIIGDRIYLLTDMIPSILMFIDQKGDFEDNLQLSSVDAGGIDDRLLSKTFTDFTRCLMSFDQPIVFIFDDIDFADQASIQIIDDFFSLNNSERIYIVLSCSDGTHGPLKGHVTEFLTKIDRFRRRYQKLPLKPLTLQQTSNLIYHILGVRYNGILPIASYLYQVCQGSPIHLIEKLKDLALHGDITHSLENQHWSYNIDDIKAVTRPLTTVDLFLTRLATFDDETVHILEAASVYGMHFEKSVLFITGVSSRGKLDHILDKLARESLIKKDYDADPNGDSYSFVHSHYRDVVLYHLDSDRKTAIHLATAIELSKAKKIPDEKTIFTITHHYKKGLEQKNSYLPLKKSTITGAFYFAVKAGQLAKAKQTVPCAIEFYEFAVNLMNNYLSAEQMDPGVWEKVYFEYITLLLKERLYRRATGVLRKIFNTKIKIYTHNRALVVKENLLECYLVLLLRTSNYQKISSLTQHYLREMGIDLSAEKLSYKKGRFYDHLYFSRKIKSATSSPTALLLHQLRKKVSSRQPKPRSILLLNYYYLSLDPQSEAAINCHLVAMNQAASYLKKQDLIQLLRHRLRLLNDHGMRQTASDIAKYAKASVNSLKNQRFSALMEINLSCDHDFSYNYNYRNVRAFVLGNRLKYCYSIQDFEEISNLHAANLTRLFLQANVTDFNHFLPVIRQHFSTRGPHFTFVLMLIVSHYACLHKKDKIEQIVMDFLENKTFQKVHTSDVFFQLTTALCMIHISRWDEGIEAYKRATSILAVNPKLTKEPAYKVEFLMFAFWIFPAFFEAFSKKRFWPARMNKVLIHILNHRFHKDHPLKLVITNVIQLSENKLSHKQKLKIFGRWKKAIADLGTRDHKILWLYLRAQFARWQHATAGDASAAANLLGIIKDTQKKRLIGITLIVEDMLSRERIPYQKREERLGIERKPSMFDEMITNLYLLFLGSYSHPDFHRLATKVKCQIAYGLFKEKYGADDCLIVYNYGSRLEPKGLLSDNQPNPLLVSEIKARVGSAHTDFFPLINLRPVKEELDLDLEVNEERSRVSTPAENSGEEAAATLAVNQLTVNEQTVVTGASKPAEEKTPDPTKTVVSSPNPDLTTADHLPATLEQRSEIASRLPPIIGCLIPIQITKKPSIYLYIHNLGNQYNLDELRARKEISLWGKLLCSGLKPIKQRLDYQITPFVPRKMELRPCSWLNLSMVYKPHQLSRTAWVLSHELKSYQYLVVYLDIKGLSQTTAGDQKDSAPLHPVSAVIRNHFQMLMNNPSINEESTLLEQLKNDMMYLIDTFDKPSSEILNVSGFFALMGEKHCQAYLFGDSTAFSTETSHKSHLSKTRALYRYISGGPLLYRKFIVPTSDHAFFVLSSPLGKKRAVVAAQKTHNFHNDKIWNKLKTSERENYLGEVIQKKHSGCFVLMTSKAHEQSRKPVAEPIPA